MEKYKYIEWFNAPEMHEHSKDWFSELSFVKREQQFLNNLIQLLAVKPMDKTRFALIKDFKKELIKNKNTLLTLLKEVQKHMNQLEIIIDDVDQLVMERAYRITHKDLFSKVEDYLLSYRTIKEGCFTELSVVLKESKRLSLDNPEYKLTTSELTTTSTSKSTS